MRPFHLTMESSSWLCHSAAVLREIYTADKIKILLFCQNLFTWWIFCHYVKGKQLLSLLVCFSMESTPEGKNLHSREKILSLWSTSGPQLMFKLTMFWKELPPLHVYPFFLIRFSYDNCYTWQIFILKIWISYLVVLEHSVCHDTVLCQWSQGTPRKIICSQPLFSLTCINTSWAKSSLGIVLGFFRQLVKLRHKCMVA